ncbi:hypothetical protein I6I99_10960 [Sphingobacterium multivorum]|nr:hypothetical protein [Sphingobacterium multivorum]QQT33046.1 hypothetical protein I6I99_10960 [Sphingobacterium multivorum]
MKQLFIILFLTLGAKITHAQTTVIAAAIRSAYEGTWQYKTKFQSNTVRVQFEPGKDYAIFTDIGSGEAPAKTFKAVLKGKLLIMPAVRNQNDDIELEIIGRTLHLRTTQAVWDNNGNRIKPNNPQIDQRIFKRIKSP